MLGIRGDELHYLLITSSFSDTDIESKEEAAEAIVKISGNKAIPSLINYMVKFS